MTSYIEAVEKLIDQQDDKSIRIRELEAKLAKAVEALKAIYREYDPSEDGQNAATMYGISCEALAELEK